MPGISPYNRDVTNTLRPEALVIVGSFNSGLLSSLQVSELRNMMPFPDGLGYDSVVELYETDIADLLLDVLPLQTYFP